MIRLISFILLISFFPLVGQSVIINEIMSSNNASIVDEDAEYSDWIEIFNPTDSTINLLDFSISDNPDSSSKWIFPEYFIPSNDYLVLFCSGKNRKTDFLHTNFKIKSSGECISLFDSSGQIVDKIDSVEIPNDISLGRGAENRSDWFFYSPATPGFENNTNSYLGRTESPEFSEASGFFNNTVFLNLFNSNPEIEIYYTIDGSEPTINSLKYMESFEIIMTSVVRAKSFKTGLLPSKTITNTFFINENISLPIISISTDPKNFFDDTSGIYIEGTNGIIDNCSELPMNYNRDWEKPINIEFFETDGSLKFNINAGIKIYGGCTRMLPQKSLEIIARGEYGSKTIPYKIFPNLPFSEYNSIVLRNSGNDNSKTFIRDALMQGLVEKLDLETQAYRPAILFLNGEYWGIHNIRERNNKHYLKQHHSIDPENIDLLRDKYSILEGDNVHFREMYRFIETHDLSLDSNYNYVKKLLDIDNYITYMLSQMFFANTDWFPGNMKFWRPKTIDGKWRWILFDTDLGFFNDSFANKNMIDWVSNPTRYPSTIFNGLISNENFKKKFINTCADYLNSHFNTEVIVSKISEYASGIEKEIPRHSERWSSPSIKWNENIQILKDFANIRPDIMMENFNVKYNLEGTETFNVDINRSRNGSISINSIVIENFPWQGKYFVNTPIKVQAIPNSGFKFLRWINSDSTYSKSDIIEVTLKEVNSLLAEFASDSSNVDDVIINEINYNSNNNFNSGDWVEILNISDSTVNLSNWTIKDSNDSNDFFIPVNTYLKEYEYLVICSDSSAFKLNFPKVNNIISGMNFKFSSKGEIISIYNASKFLVDSVRYSQNSPWPTKANGDGYTLELLNPRLNNSISTNWNASFIFGGSPGSTNSSLVYKNLFINEFMAINNNDILDEYGENEDWIELFNKSDFPISLKNIYITDNTNNLLKYKLLKNTDSLNIAPDEFLLYWADEEMEQGLFHLDFKLNGTQEEIGISMYNGLEVFLIDSVSYLEQIADQSYGRFPDAYKRFIRFETPTPLNYNSTLDNHSPYFSNKLSREFIIQPDSLISIFLWEYVEDVETPDSLLNYYFSVSSDILNFNFTKENGHLMLFFDSLGQEEKVELIIKVEDQQGFFITDTIGLNFQKLTDISDFDFIPNKFSLSQNYPNPFNPSTKIKFGLPKESKVSIIVYNALGQEVNRIIDQQLNAGYHEVDFNNTNYSSGIYFYRIQAYPANGEPGDTSVNSEQHFVETRKMILLK